MQPLRIRPDRRVTVGFVTMVPEYPGVTSYAIAAWYVVVQECE